MIKTKYEYDYGVKIKFNDNKIQSYSKLKHGPLFDLLIKQIEETGFKIRNPYKIIDDKTVEIYSYNIQDDEILTILIDYDDWLKYRNTFWSVKLKKNYPSGVITINENKKQRVFLHRLIMNYFEPGNKIVVDHKNRNTLDNRKDNLRIVSQKLNVKNRGLETKLNKSSGILGISKSKKKGYNWRVCCQTLSGEYIEKNFSCLEEAKEYNLKIRKENGYIE